MKPLTTKEKISLVEQLLCHYRAMDAMMDAMYKLFGSAPDCNALNPFWCAFDGYVKAVAIAIGDKEADWLSWFIWDNACGTKAMKAGYDGKTRKIETVKQLVNLIEQGEKR